jgi:hypothetical protein
MFSLKEFKEPIPIGRAAARRPSHATGRRTSAEPDRAWTVTKS